MEGTLRRLRWGLFSIPFMGAAALAQEAFKASLSSSLESESKIHVAWTQVASGLEGPSPIQFQPLLGISYAWDDTWFSAVNYDFQSLVFETRCRMSEVGAWTWGLVGSLMPELRSFSWKAGPWINRALGRGQLTAFATLASINALGYGLWAADYDVSSRGRAWVLPLQLNYAWPLAERLQLKAGFEGQWGLTGATPKNRFSMMIGFTKGFQ